jgi:site-specific recombinase XerD
MSSFQVSLSFLATWEEIIIVSRVFSAEEAKIMGIAVAHDPAPTIVNSKVERTREYLTQAEVGRLMEAARKTSRYGHRDATMVLIAYRHGLRASELCDLQWSQVELNTGRLHVRRSKRGTPSVHPLQGDEIRALRRLQRDQCHPTGATASPSKASPFVFCTERGGPMAPKSFHYTIARLAMPAGIPFAVHPHMLRHGCGYALANAGHDTRAIQAWMGHRNIQHTVRYTELAPTRFKAFWR